MKFIVIVVTYIILVYTAKFINSFPVVYVSWSTKKCVKVIKYGQEFPCSCMDLKNDKYITRLVE